MPLTRNRHHIPAIVRFDVREIARAVREVEGINAKLAVAVTHAVGTMACAYAFGLLALVSFPAAIASGSTIVIVAWIAQTFLQLVLLSVIMVGQRVQAAASEARATQTVQDVTEILDRLDVRTEGGLQVVVDRLNLLSDQLLVRRDGT